MALIVEDGSIVENANSYVTREYVITYANSRGVTLPDDDTTDVLIIKAMDFVSMFDAEWVGKPVEPRVQPLAWPREYVIVGSYNVGFDEIPIELQKAVAQLVVEQNAGINLTPSTDNSAAFVVREKIDVIETEYSEALALQRFGNMPTMPIVMANLTPLFRNGGNRLRSVRI